MLTQPPTYQRARKPRKSLRSTYRYDQASARELDALKRALSVDDDSEAIRTAISLALAQVGGGR